MQQGGAPPTGGAPRPPPPQQQQPGKPPHQPSSGGTLLPLPAGAQVPQPGRQMSHPQQPGQAPRPMTSALGGLAPQQLLAASQAAQAAARKVSGGTASPRPVSPAGGVQGVVPPASLAVSHGITLADEALLNGNPAGKQILAALKVNPGKYQPSQIRAYINSLRSQQQSGSQRPQLKPAQPAGIAAGAVRPGQPLQHQIFRGGTQSSSPAPYLARQGAGSPAPGATPYTSPSGAVPGQTPQQLQQQRMQQAQAAAAAAAAGAVANGGARPMAPRPAANYTPMLGTPAPSAPVGPYGMPANRGPSAGAQAAGAVVGTSSTVMPARTATNAGPFPPTPPTSGVPLTGVNGVQRVGTPPVPAQPPSRSLDLLPPAKLQKLLQDIDPKAALGPEVTAALEGVAADFMGKTLEVGCAVARRRGSEVLAPADLQVGLARMWGVHVPGFEDREFVPYRRPAASDMHRARQVAVRKGATVAGRAAAAASTGPVTPAAAASDAK